MKIINHRLHNDDDTPVPFVPSPNIGGVLHSKFLIIHFTAGRSAQSSIVSLCDPLSKASAHLVIGRDGAITQLVSFDTVAWHAGQSQWMGHVGLNRSSIGMELDNAGRLRREGGTWKAWFAAAIPDQEVLEAAHKNETQPAGWHTFTEPQIEKAAEVSTLLAREYGIEDVLGHDDISPGRKVDPGPAFPMASFRSKVMGREDSEPATLVTKTTLNIRSGPGTEYKTVPGSPLAPKTPVRVLKVEGVWFQVDVLKTSRRVSDIVGWVHSRFLQPV